MISSIGSYPTYDLNSISKPTTGLDAQIARYKKELSDCVNCESAKTAKGKAKIQAISDKLTALTAQTENAAKPKDTNQLTTMSGTPPTNNQFSAGHKYDIAPVSEFDFEPIGNNLNVFA